MSTLTNRRWLIAAFALCVVAGLQLAAVPPEVFANPGVCVMACNEQGRACCCKGSAGERTEPHAPEAAADGLLAPFEPLCRELCATFITQAPSVDSWHGAEARREPSRTTRGDRHPSSLTTPPRLDRSDPSTLPRPPPFPIARS